MSNEEVLAELAALRQLKTEQDIEDAITLAANAGILAADPNFDWRDLEIQ